MGPGEPKESLHNVTQNPSNGSSSKAGQVTYSIISLLLVFMLGAFVFLWRKRRNSFVDPNLIPLGEYQFDKRNTEL